MIIEEWIRFLINPKKVIKAEAKYVSFAKGIKHILFSVLIYTLMNYIFGSIPYSASFGIILDFIILFAAISLFIFTGWVMLSGIYYTFAVSVFGGKGTIDAQSYFLSIIFAELFVLTGLTKILPFPLSTAADIIIFLYILFLTNVMLKEVHRLSYDRAFLSWFIPLILFFYLALISGMILYSILEYILIGAQQTSFIFL